MRTLSFITAVVLILCISSVAFASRLVLIVNKQNPVSRLSQQDVKRIFLGKRMTWPNKSLITTITQKRSETHRQFVRAIIRQTSQEYSQYWKHLVRTGRGIPPKSVATDNEVKAAVSTNVNAIGYIDEQSLDRSVKKVKVH